MLEGRGRRPWVQVRGELAGFECVWVERYGLRWGPAPAGPPITTHLWGWSGRTYVRVRFDRDGGEDVAYLGLLHEPGTSAVGEPVTVHERSARLRSGQDGRMVDLLEVPGPGPVTFLRAGRGPDAAAG